MLIDRHACFTVVKAEGVKITKANGEQEKLKIRWVSYLLLEMKNVADQLFLQD